MKRKNSVFIHEFEKHWKTLNKAHKMYGKESIYQVEIFIIDILVEFKGKKKRIKGNDEWLI